MYFHPWVMEIQICTNEGWCPLQRAWPAEVELSDKMRNLVHSDHIHVYWFLCKERVPYFISFWLDEPLLAKRVLTYFSGSMSYKEGFIKIPQNIYCCKKYFCQSRRHLTLMIGDHDIFFHKYNFFTVLIMTFPNIVNEIRTLFAKNGLDFYQIAFR
jgi:hypothetical protein